MKDWVANKLKETDEKLERCEDVFDRIALAAKSYTYAEVLMEIIDRETKNLEETK